MGVATIRNLNVLLRILCISVLYCITKAWRSIEQLSVVSVMRLSAAIGYQIEIYFVEPGERISSYQFADKILQGACKIL